MNRLGPQAASLRYLARLTDENGIVEHARWSEPFLEGGYCTDDAGRLLALACRMNDDPDAERLVESALSFLERAYIGDGQFRLRWRRDQNWTRDPRSDDATGRALLGLGTAVALAREPDVRARACAIFDDAASFRSGFLHATAYAALGAAQVFTVQPDHEGAARLLDRTEILWPPRTVTARWPWPESRLRYDNAVLPEAAFAAATLRGDATLAARALEQLRWLVARQTRDEHFSFVPVAGRDVTSPVTPAFDQQPIEAWSVASAAARAFAHTGDLHWRQVVTRAAAWFFGDNDVGAVMFDPVTGGGFDGLEPAGVNQNQGAESSMAFVATVRALREVRGELTEALTTSSSAR